MEVMLTQNWDLKVQFVNGLDDDGLNKLRRDLVLDLVTSCLRNAFDPSVGVEMKLRDEDSVHADIK